MFIGTIDARAGVLVQDNFNDNSIDQTKWTPNPNSGTVVEANGRIEITNRGYLDTAAQYDPLVQGPLRITGEWTFQNADWPGHDIMAVLTRSDAVPTGTYRETQNGIEFQLNGDGGLRILSRVNGVETYLAPILDFEVNSGERFFFDARDDGLNLSFFVQQIGGAGRSASLTATSPLDFGSDLIVFHNRENSSTAYLDNVTIEQVPEPSTFVLASLGSLGILGYAVKRRNRRVR